jgi:hypothetical protein
MFVDKVGGEDARPMMRDRFSIWQAARVAALSGLAVFAGIPQAGAGPGMQFTADAVQSQPGQPARSGKLQVGEKGSRFEFVENGQTIVQITRIDGIVRLLFPATRTYMEMKAPPGIVPSSMTPEAPCTPSPEIDCRNVGEEQAATGKLQHWMLTPKGATASMRIWWDVGRRMPLRQEMPDGSVMQATLKGTRQFDGRTVESWDILLATTDGKRHDGVVLYAPDIGLTVMEQQPGGTVRELRHIVVAPMDPVLLEVPAGYNKVDPQTMLEGQQGARR